MSHNDLGRRRFLHLSARGTVTLWLSATAAELVASLAAGCAPHDQETTLSTLTPAQAADIDALTALIIPSGDTPGAREAKVTRFIDRSLATFAREQRPLFERHLSDLKRRAAAVSPGTTSFAALSEPHQVALLRAVETEQPDFFDALRAATVTGMFANPEYGGNTGKVGWHLLGFQDTFSWQPPFGEYDQPGPDHA